MDDLISRQAAIDDLHGKDPSQIWDTADVEVWINALPSAQPKIGKWKERKVFSAGIVDDLQSARCSACGFYHITPYLHYFDNFKYCPECGAKMEEE